MIDSKLDSCDDLPNIYNSAALINHDDGEYFKDSENNIDVEENDEINDTTSSNIGPIISFERDDSEIRTRRAGKLFIKKGYQEAEEKLQANYVGLAAEFKKPMHQVSLEANKAIKASKEYKKMRSGIRALNTLMYIILILGSPLVFRYAMASNVDSYQGGNLTFEWYREMIWVDWIVLITLLLECFGNIMRYLPMMSGFPSEYDQKGLREIVVTGKAAMVHVTPLDSEKDGIFLRSLVGRTATLLHTAGSRHDIQTLYIDVLMNEDPTNVNRVEKWKAWVQFVELLCNLKPEDMRWSEMKNNFKTSRETAVTCQVSFGYGRTASYKIDPFAVEFEGYKIDNTDTKHETCVTVPRQGPVLNEHTDRLGKENAATYGVFKSRIESILPAICFVDGWLEVLKARENSFENFSKDYVLQQMINAAPCSKFFEGGNLLLVNEGLVKLFTVFSGNGNIRQNDDSVKPSIYRDSIFEFRWQLTRHGMSTIDISWFYFTRSKINSTRAIERNQSFYKYVLRAIVDPIPDPTLNCTRKKVGSIVYIKDSFNDLMLPQRAFASWKKARATTFKIIEINHQDSGENPSVKISVWPDAPSCEENELVVKMSQLELICGVGGKAGALNTCLDLVRRRTRVWSHEIGHDHTSQPLQLFFGVVDARHMIAEPEIFWNDTIPYFAHLKNNEAAKNIGLSSPVILIQFPQHFNHVSKNSYLDSRNFIYNSVWQTIRDCSKTTNSNGTNTIWDATDPYFKIATISSFEPTATTQNFIKHYHTIYLPVFVAYGVAKETSVEQLEALHRRSTGSIQLMWSTVFSWKVYHYFVATLLLVAFTLACVHPNCILYYIWLGFVVIMAIVGDVEKGSKMVPFRRFNVSFTIVLNTMSWISNILSITWLIIVPTFLSFYNYVPLAQTPLQTQFYAYVALIVVIPPTIMMDSVIYYVSFLNTKGLGGSKINFRIENLRTSQLFACSFGYTVLAFIHGTFSSIVGHFFDRDNTRLALSNKQSHLKLKTLSLGSKIKHFIYNAWRGLNSPDTVTRIWVGFLLLYQIACIIGGYMPTQNIRIYNNTALNADVTVLTLSFCVCNLFLIKDIALAFFPWLDSQVSFNEFLSAILFSPAIKDQFDTDKNKN